MDRSAFLQRVREAVAEGNRAGAVPPLPVRGAVGYQGASSEPERRFGEALTAAGGFFHPVSDNQSAAAAVLQLVEARGARKVLLGRGPALDPLALAAEFKTKSIEVIEADTVQPAQWRQEYFPAEVGISGVAYLIAETGTMVMACRPDDPRSVSLLPPIHIAVADRRQLLPDLFDLFERVGGKLPSCLTLITGPSKTGDIELKLVTGVHGPGEVHVVYIGG